LQRKNKRLSTNVKNIFKRWKEAGKVQRKTFKESQRISSSFQDTREENAIEIPIKVPSKFPRNQKDPKKIPKKIQRIGRELVSN